MTPAEGVVSSFRHRLFDVAVAVAIGLSAVGGTAGTVAATASDILPNRVVVQPTHVLAQMTAPAHFACQDNAIGAGRCYSPAQIRAAYGIDQIAARGITGKRRTIVIVDAFSNPYVQSDLKIFDSTFGLPDPELKIVAPQGVPAFDFGDPVMTGWAGEITLDVQWAHAIAPEARIVLVEAKSSNDDDILAATRYAVERRLGDVISQSFGEGEACMDRKLLRQQHELFEKASGFGITLVAGSGDWGAASSACDNSDSFFKAVSTPASDPNVTAVGGTTLTADAAGRWQNEYTWSEGVDIGIPCLTASNDGCSGGGFSSVYSRPAYQADIRSIPRDHRGVPDVAYNAGVDGGVLTHDGVDLELYGFDPMDPAAFFRFGGTSAGAPQWAGLVALADQVAGHPIGRINGTLYALASAAPSIFFHDVVKGTNNFAGIVGYKAARGWDPVTGLGSPRAASLVWALALGR